MDYFKSLLVIEQMLESIAFSFVGFSTECHSLILNLFKQFYAEYVLELSKII